MITPFVATIEVPDPSNKVFKVVVKDADGVHVVDVEPVFDLRSCGTASKDAKPAGTPAPKPGRCRGWYAILDKMPPKPYRLIVTGECTFPTPGWKVELRPRVPQGVNPQILLLERIVTPPAGIATVDYTQVDIDGVVVDVQVVH